MAIDLFSGAGGLGAGIEAAGWTVVSAVDHDEAALETHRANFRGQAHNIDMHNTEEVSELINSLKPLGVDLVAGGPPCQPFSRAGRAKIRSLVNAGTRDEVDARKDLWKSFLEVVLALMPRAVIMENVPDMAIGDDLHVIRNIALLLEKAGYTVDYRLLDAWRYGVPQHRKRFILQARNDGQCIEWPITEDEITTVRDAISDLPLLRDSTGSREQVLSMPAHSSLATELRDARSNVIYDHITRSVRDDDLEAFKLMTSSTLYSDLPERLRRYRSDTFVDKYKRLDWDELSRTITAHIAKDGYWYIHPEEHRTLSVREAARIQTFPDSFRFAGSRSDAFRQIGNAVPPKLGYAVASSIRHKLEKDQYISPVPQMRIELAAWSVQKRRDSWWLFPGPNMTLAAAAIASALDVHRLSPDRAKEIMEPLSGKKALTSDLLSHIDASTLSERRRSSIRLIRKILREEKGLDWLTEFHSILSETQQQIFSILRGEKILLVNPHINKVVTLLMNLPESQNGLKTNTKVALAQLVALGEEASLRMSAIRLISISEARSKILEKSMLTSTLTRKENAS